MKTEKDPKKISANMTSFMLVVTACACIVLEIVHANQTGEPINSFFVGCGLLLLAGGIYNLLKARN